MNRFMKLLSLLAVFALIVAACSSDSDDTTTTTAAAGGEETTTTAAAAEETTTTAAPEKSDARCTCATEADAKGVALKSANTLSMGRCSSSCSSAADANRLAGSFSRHFITTQSNSPRNIDVSLRGSICRTAANCGSESAVDSRVLGLAGSSS